MHSYYRDKVTTEPTRQLVALKRLHVGINSSSCKNTTVDITEYKSFVTQPAMHPLFPKMTLMILL